MADRILQLPEDRVTGHRLGRHIRHDPRSMRYLVQATGVVQTKIWEHKIPVLDQGDVGSCTGNATTGVLGTEPYFDTLNPTQQKLDEADALEFYSLATQLDDFPGTYPGQDTGSDGLSVAKAAQQMGYISGYQHITSIAAAQTAILSGPFIVGTNWMSGMDTPKNGLVKAIGTNRGGHEYCCFGFDASANMWHFVNSWGTSWGDQGTFMYSTTDFGVLLKAQGDATTFVPLTEPAPQPTPEPTPTPAKPFPIDDVRGWLPTANHTKAESRAKAAIKGWLG